MLAWALGARHTVRLLQYASVAARLPQSSTCCFGRRLGVHACAYLPVWVYARWQPVRPSACMHACAPRPSYVLKHSVFGLLGSLTSAYTFMFWLADCLHAAGCRANRATPSLYGGACLATLLCMHSSAFCVQQPHTYMRHSWSRTRHSHLSHFTQQARHGWHGMAPLWLA